jgi:hypothetical protein
MVQISVCGQTLAASGDSGVADASGTIDIAELTDPTKQHSVTLDFLAKTTVEGMQAEFRVAREVQTTASVVGGYYSYSTFAPENATIITRTVPDPCSADTRIMVTVDGKVLSSSGSDGQAILFDTLDISRLQGSDTPHSLTLDFGTEDSAMIAVYRVGQEGQAATSVNDSYYSYSTTATENSAIVTRVIPAVAGSECMVMLTVDGRTLGGSSYPGQVGRFDSLFPSEYADQQTQHDVTLDFYSDSASMQAEFRVGEETQVVQPVAGHYYSYSTVAPDASSVVTHVVPDTAMAWSFVSITVDGKLLGGSSRPGGVLRFDSLWPDDLDRWSTETHVVELEFGTESAGMRATYRVGSESAVTVDASSHFAYTTSAQSGATIIALAEPDVTGAQCGITVRVDGAVIGGSSRPGQVIRWDYVP